MALPQARSAEKAWPETRAFSRRTFCARLAFARVWLLRAFGFRARLAFAAWNQVVSGTFEDRGESAPRFYARNPTEIGTLRSSAQAMVNGARRAWPK
jgi:hypothetical protein